MNKSKDKIRSLVSLAGFHSSKELNQVFNDLTDYINGTQIIYAVDTFDVIAFSFPFSLDKNTIELRDEMIALNFVCYDFLFNKYKYNPIILDEYKVELYRIIKSLSDFLQKYPSKNEIKNQFLKDYKETLNKKDFLSRQLGISLALEGGLLNKDSVKRFFHLIKERLQIDGFKLEQIELIESIKERFNSLSDENEIYDIVKSTKPDQDLVYEIYEEFINKNADFYKNKDNAEITKHKNSTFLDIKVFARIYEINKKLKKSWETDRLTKNFKMYYLSSTPSKSDILQDIFNKKLKGNLGSNLLRKNYQFYFLEVMKALMDYYKNHNDYYIENVIKEGMNKCINTYETIERWILENPLIYRKVEKDLRLDQVQLENSFLQALIWKNKDFYINKIKSIENNKESDELDLINKELLNNILKGDKDLLYEGIDRDIKNISKSHVIYLNLFKGNIDASLPVSYGIIRSKIQSIPLLLFCTLEIPDNVKNSFYKELIKLISKKSFRYTERLKLNEIKKYFLLSSYENKLLLSLFELLMIDRLENRTERKILEDLEDLRLKKHFLKFEKRLLDNYVEKKVIENSDTVFIDLLYFITWLKRRSNNVDMMKDALNQIIAFEDNFRTKPDLRLIQSKALLLLNLGYFTKNKEKKIYYYKKSIEICSLAFDLIEKKENFLKNKCEIIKYVEIGLKNTYVYLHCTLAILNNNYANIFLRPHGFLRKIIIEIKDNLKERYSDYLCLNHTELELEYCEIMYYKRIGDSLKAEKIYNHGKVLINKIQQDEEMNNHKKVVQKTIKRFLKLYS